MRVCWLIILLLFLFRIIYLNVRFWNDYVPCCSCSYDGYRLDCKNSSSLYMYVYYRCIRNSAESILSDEQICNQYSCYDIAWACLFFYYNARQSTDVDYFIMSIQELGMLNYTFRPRLVLVCIILRYFVILFNTSHSVYYNKAELYMSIHASESQDPT